MCADKDIVGRVKRVYSPAEPAAAVRPRRRPRGHRDAQRRVQDELRGHDGAGCVCTVLVFFFFSFFYFFFIFGVGFDIALVEVNDEVLRFYI